jgi:hypothetical protein
VVVPSKWLDYLGGNTVIHTGRGTEGDLVRGAFVHQLEATYAQREFDEQREAERKNILERIEQADREQRERLAAARGQRKNPSDDFSLIREIFKECEERLSREKLLVYKLNEQRTRVESFNYLYKREAVEKTKVAMGGDLLDLDCEFSGMIMCEDYIFVSEETAVEALRKYEPEPVALLNGLLAEVAASERPLFKRAAG